MNLKCLVICLLRVIVSVFFRDLYSVRAGWVSGDWDWPAFQPPTASGTRRKPDWPSAFKHHPSPVAAMCGRQWPLLLRASALGEGSSTLDHGHHFSTACRWRWRPHPRQGWPLSDFLRPWCRSPVAADLGQGTVLAHLLLAPVHRQELCSSLISVPLQWFLAAASGSASGYSWRGCYHKPTSRGTWKAHVLPQLQCSGPQFWQISTGCRLCLEQSLAQSIPRASLETWGSLVVNSSKAGDSSPAETSLGSPRIRYILSGKPCACARLWELPEGDWGKLRRIPPEASRL